MSLLEAETSEKFNLQLRNACQFIKKSKDSPWTLYSQNTEVEGAELIVRENIILNKESPEISEYIKHVMMADDKFSDVKNKREYIKRGYHKNLPKPEEVLVHHKKLLNMVDNFYLPDVLEKLNPPESGYYAPSFPDFVLCRMRHSDSSTEIELITKRKQGE